MTNRHPRKVEVILLGGLGNQLFGWAAGLSLAKRLECKLVLNISQLNNRSFALPRYLHQSAEISEKIPYYYQINSRILKRIYRNIPFFGEYFEQSSNFEDRFHRISAPAKLHGYFQSVKYFEENLPEVTSLINRRENLTQEYLELEDDFPHDFVAIHFRRGDYLINQDYHPLTTIEYYEEAIRYLDSKGINQSKIIFTDDEKLAKEAFPNEIIFTNSDLKSPFDNLYLMGKARAIIGANSSFSLWAGLSVNSRGGICIFPQKWFGRKDMLDLSPVPPDFLKF